MIGVCGWGILLELVLNRVYSRLIWASANMAQSNNKLAKSIKIKFETYYKLKIGVNNVDIFVDKYILQHKFGGILLSTWDNYCGQALVICLLLGSISTILGLIYDCGKFQILSTFSVGILTSGMLIFLEGLLNMSNKKDIVRINMKDYLENHLKVRLEQELTNPELIEQYKKEYYLMEESSREESKDEDVAVGLESVVIFKKKKSTINKFQQKKLKRQRKEAKNQERISRMEAKKTKKEKKNQVKKIILEKKREAKIVKKAAKEEMKIARSINKIEGKNMARKQEIKTVAQERKENLLKEIQGRRVMDSVDENIEFLRGSKESILTLEEQVAITRIEENFNRLKEEIEMVPFDGSWGKGKFSGYEDIDHKDYSLIIRKRKVEDKKEKKNQFEEDKIIEDILREYLG